jgi:hypothetical protein
MLSTLCNNCKTIFRNWYDVAGHLRIKCQALVCGMVALVDEEYKIAFGGLALQQSRVHPDTDPHHLDEHLFYMPILLVTSPDISDDEEFDIEGGNSMRGLVLRSAGNHSFVRVGAFEYGT